MAMNKRKADTLFFQLVQVVGPCLHHRMSLFQEFGSVVCPAQGIFYPVGKLMFEKVRAKLQFLGTQGSEGSPESVAGYLILGVYHSP